MDVPQGNRPHAPAHDTKLLSVTLCASPNWLNVQKELPFKLSFLGYYRKELKAWASSIVNFFNSKAGACRAVQNCILLSLPNCIDSSLV